MKYKVPPNYALSLASLSDANWAALQHLVLGARNLLRSLTARTRTRELITGRIGTETVLIGFVGFWSLPPLRLSCIETEDIKPSWDFVPESFGMQAQLRLNPLWFERIADAVVRADMLCLFCLRGSVVHGASHFDGYPLLERTLDTTLNQIMDRARLRLRTICTNSGAIGSVLLAYPEHWVRRTHPVG